MSPARKYLINSDKYKIKNMAANLDKSENSLTSVSTLTYLRGIDASGNSVKISTSDLASVLGVARNINPSDLNDVINPGVYWINNLDIENVPVDYSWGILVVFKYQSNSIHQMYYLDTTTPTFVRVKGNSGWTSWSRIYDDTILSDATVLSNLANALGVPLYCEVSLSSDIIDALNTSFSSVSQYSKFEGTIANTGYFIGFRGSSEGRASAILFCIDSTYIVHRNLRTSSGIWTAYAITQ